jgi:hypothetical protein
MKKLFLNPRFLHGFYAVVLVVLAIAIYFTKVEKEKYQAIGACIDESMPILKSDIKGIIEAFALYTSAYSHSHSALMLQNSLLITDEYERVDCFLDKTINDFEKYLSEKPSLLRKTKIPSQFYFTEAKIKECENVIAKFQTVIAKNIEDPSDLKEFSIGLNPISLKSLSRLSGSFALLELRKVRLCIGFSEVGIMNFFNSRYTGCGGVGSPYLVGLNIASYPSKVGDTLIGDVLLTNYHQNLWVYRNLDMSFYANGQELEKNGENIIFKTSYQKEGWQNIEGKINLKNKKTGGLETINSNCSFFVNPK